MARPCLHGCCSKDRCHTADPEPRPSPWPYPQDDLNGTRTDKEVGWN